MRGLAFLLFSVELKAAIHRPAVKLNTSEVWDSQAKGIYSQLRLGIFMDAQSSVPCTDCST